ncbi:MAG: hypothetical protein AB7O24_11980 [Kofleriaceae bacterium]
MIRQSLTACLIAMVAACGGDEGGISTIDDCVVEGAGMWTVTGTIPAGTCYFGNPADQAWMSTLTLRFTNDAMEGLVVTADDSRFGSSVQATMSPVLSHDGGTCEVEGTLVDASDAALAFTFRFASGTEAEIPVRIQYDATCDDAFSLSATR